MQKQDSIRKDFQLVKTPSTAPPSESPNLHSMGLRDLLRLAPMRRLWTAQFISVAGDFIAIFAVFSLISFRLHGTAAEVSLVMISYLLPMAVISPIAGVFADRWHPRRTMIASDLIRAVLVCLLLWAVRPIHVYVIFALLSAVSAFFVPAQTIVLRTLVPPQGLMSANALMMQALQITQILSPALAGALCKVLGERACFILDAASFLVSAYLVSGIPLEWHAHATNRNLRSAMTDLREGMRFLMTHGTLGFTILAMGAGLFAVRCYSALIAVYVRDILHAGTGLFGTLGTMVGVGMIIGSQLVQRMAKRVQAGYLMLGGLTGVALTILMLALTSSIFLALSATVGIGLCVALIVVSSQTVTQGQTPVAMLGRVSSSTMAVMALAQVGGMALSGSTAQVLGIRNSYLLSSVILLAIAALGIRYAGRIGAPALGAPLSSAKTA